MIIVYIRRTRAFNSIPVSSRKLVLEFKGGFLGRRLEIPGDPAAFVRGDPCGSEES
jgi:hypothetical protein